MAEDGPLSLLMLATILALINILAFSIRLFSIIKYESIIHEFDPYFNYRVTQYLTKAGIYEFWNWFDDRTWYPLGRVIRGTVYPCLTLTAGTMWWIFGCCNGITLHPPTTSANHVGRMPSSEMLRRCAYRTTIYVHVHDCHARFRPRPSMQ